MRISYDIWNADADTLSLIVFRYSVNVFQPPVDNSTSSSNNDTILSDSSDISTNSNTSSQSTSSKAVNVNVPSSTTSNSCNSTKANKRQMVLGEPRNKTNLDSKLFIVRRLQQLDYVIGDTIVDTNGDTD
ncbi:unnamed protein product [Anisakis simplex]|uniref:REJ domain-containing protein n=1 Tax=Anisakis simplex TaxID=6269 RepID=A0A0M3KJQ6_ANISI|nr:unnamed protein product [Anisakis simplex]